MLASKCNCSTYNFVFKKLSFFNEKLKNIVFNPDFSKLPGVNNIALINVQVRKIGGKIQRNWLQKSRVWKDWKFEKLGIWVQL